MGLCDRFRALLRLVTGSRLSAFCLTLAA
jgi:hypothetical protein